MSEPAARIVAGAARATDRIIEYYVLREAAFGSLSLVVLAIHQDGGFLSAEPAS
jgi:hypothetical protein